MSNNPSAPPPSYDELAGNNNEDFLSIPLQYEKSSDHMKSQMSSESMPINSEMGYDLQFQTNPYAYSQMCLNASSYAVPVPQQPRESDDIQIQPIVVQPKVIQGSGLIANPDGSYDFGPYPCRVICPDCQKTTITKIQHKNSSFTHILAGLLCLLGCCCLAPVPYCIDSCKSSEHHCGECGKYLGTFVNKYTVRRYHKYNKNRPRYISKCCNNDRCGPQYH